MSKAPPRPPAPRAPSAPRSQTPPAKTSALKFGSIPASAGHRALIYGPGGIGKTTLGCAAPGPVAFIDLDESLSRLRPKLESMGLVDNIKVVEGVGTWQQLRDVLVAPGWDDIKTLVIDPVSVAQEFAIAHTLEHVKKDSGQQAKNIEDYGYGKGYQHVYDTFLPLLADLDAHARAGRHVILICHDCPSNVPNPMGADWIRYEPRLQTVASGKASIRLRVREWADHVLFIGYDVDVSAEKGSSGKATGSGTATLYPRELPHFMAKSRTLVDAIVLEECYEQLWPKLMTQDGDN